MKAGLTLSQIDPEESQSLSRTQAISRISKALNTRSGKSWSVTGGRGTAWGWLRINVPPKARNEFGYMPDAARAELAVLLGLDRPVHMQGVSIASSSDYYQEFVDRAEGRAPSVIGQPYWD